MGRKKIYTEQERRDRINAYRRSYAKNNRDIINAQKERYKDNRAHKDVERLKTLGDSVVDVMIAIVLERAGKRSIIAGNRDAKALEALKKNGYIESFVTGNGMTAVVVSDEWIEDVQRKEDILLNQIGDYWHK